MVWYAKGQKKRSVAVGASFALVTTLGFFHRTLREERLRDEPSLTLGGPGERVASPGKFWHGPAEVLFSSVRFRGYPPS